MTGFNVMGPWELGWCTLGGGGVEVLRPCRTRFCGGSRVDGWQKNGEQKLLKAIEKDEIYVESEFSNDIPRLWPKLFPTTTPVL